MQIFIVANLLAVAIANEVEYPAYPKPKYPQAASYEKNKENYAPMPYNFDWSVYDQASYNDFSHQESSDGKIVAGSYRVVLPDSRVQIVTYKADEYGYVADVKYEGEAKYDNKPYSGIAYNQPKYQKEYTSPSYNAKESYASPTTYTPAEAQPAYPVKQNYKSYASNDYKPKSAYPATYTPAKQYTEVYPTNDYKPAQKAGPATYAARPAYNQPKYPAAGYA